MKNLNQICSEILVNSVELAILWENEAAFKLASLLSLGILKWELVKKVDNIIFQNSMEWMIYLEFRERSEFRDKNKEEILEIIKKNFEK